MKQKKQARSKKEKPLPMERLFDLEVDISVHRIDGLAFAVVFTRGKWPKTYYQRASSVREALEGVLDQLPPRFRP